MVKCVPHPDRVVILVEVNKCITEYICGAHTPRQSRALLVMVKHQDQVSIGQGEKIVMDRVCDQVVTSSTEPIVEVGECKLADEISRQIYLLNRPINSDPLRSRRPEIHQHVTIWQKLDRFRIAKQRIVVIVIPN